MKSRTSCCKSVILRQDLIRFAPVWGLYTVFMLTVCLLSMASVETDYLRICFVKEFIKIYPLIAFCYALLTAQSLFGDLYVPRLCYALHAMPVKRDCYFTAHAAAGMLFAVVPNLVATLVMFPLLGSIRGYIWVWYAASIGQYLFFFGLAMLCMLLSGNRIGMNLFYGIINFFAILVNWFSTAVFGKLLYGVKIPEEPILNFCPSFSLITRDYLEVLYPTWQNYPDIAISSIEFLPSGWIYLGICVLLGLALVAAAHVLYRKRPLECAGDLLITEKLKPVFLVLFSLTVGAFFHLFGQMVSRGSAYPVLILGIVIGYLAGLMLLKRQVNVFRIKAMVPLAVILAVLGITMGITAMDPMGLVTKMPSTDEIESVAIQQGDMDYTNIDIGISKIHLDTPEQIAALQFLHNTGLAAHRSPSQRNYLQIVLGIYNYNYGDRDKQINVILTYHLKNGKDLTRYYTLSVDDETSPVLSALLSDPQITLGFRAEELDEHLDDTEIIQIYHYNSVEHMITDKTEMRDLMQAYLADCAEGHTALQWQLQATYNTEHDMYEDCSYGYLYGFRQISETETKSTIRGITLFTNSTHTIAWLESHGYALEKNHVFG